MRTSSLKYILTLFILIFGICGASAAQTNTKISSKQFTYYLLATQWIPGWCKVGTGQSGADLDYARACKSKMWLKHIMYHGLWPQNKDGTYPFDCVKVPLIESSQISFINPYTNYLTNSTSFLDHEWSKHGTCSNFYIKLTKTTSKSYYKGLNNYFTHGLKMYSAIKMPALPANINLNELIQKVHANNKNIPINAIQVMYAKDVNESSKLYLTGLWFCVHKTKSTYIKCPQESSATTDNNVKLYTR